jgi:hypothetical protein
MKLVHSKLALLAGAVWCSFALMLAAMIPLQDLDDPLVPIAPMAPMHASSFDHTSFTPLNLRASTALRALETANARHAL